MRLLLFLSMIFLALGNASGQQFRLVGNPSGFPATVNDSTYTLSVSFAADQTGNGFLPTQIDSTFRMFFQNERVYTITSVANATFSSADLTLEEYGTTDGAPSGQGLAYDPQGRETVPQAPANASGASPLLNAAIATWNFQFIGATSLASGQIAYADTAGNIVGDFTFYRNTERGFTLLNDPPNNSITMVRAKPIGTRILPTDNSAIFGDYPNDILFSDTLPDVGSSAIFGIGHHIKKGGNTYFNSILGYQNFLRTTSPKNTMVGSKLNLYGNDAFIGGYASSLGTSDTTPGQISNALMQSSSAYGYGSQFLLSRSSNVGIQHGLAFGDDMDNVSGIRSAFFMSGKNLNYDSTFVFGKSYHTYRFPGKRLLVGNYDFNTDQDTIGREGEVLTMRSGQLQLDLSSSTKAQIEAGNSVSIQGDSVATYEINNLGQYTARVFDGTTASRLLMTPSLASLINGSSANLRLESAGAKLGYGANSVTVNADSVDINGPINYNYSGTEAVSATGTVSVTFDASLSTTAYKVFLSIDNASLSTFEAGELSVYANNKTATGFDIVFGDALDAGESADVNWFIVIN